MLHFVSRIEDDDKLKNTEYKNKNTKMDFRFSKNNLKLSSVVVMMDT
jgi:hypothetical protein